MLHRRTSIVFLAALFAAASLQAITYVMPTDREMVAHARGIVLGTATESHVELLGDGRIVTITTFAVDSTLKGQIEEGTEIRLVVPGGATANRAFIIPGMPLFAPGQRYLLFLHRNRDGWIPLGAGLGQFEFANDALTGRSLAVRSNWQSATALNSDGSAHLETYRDAAKFIDFIRTVAKDELAPAAAAYSIEPSQTVRFESTRLKLAPNFTRQSYLLAFTGPIYGRWQNPTASFVYCCSGTPAGASAGGTAANGLDGPTAMDAAFANWNGTGFIHYTKTGLDNTAIGRLAGLGGGAFDGKNSIIFNDPFNDIFSTFGVSNIAAIGGFGTTGTTYTVGTESFQNIAEADVVAGRFASLPISQATYNGVVTHEFGHTLGLRHSDGTGLSSSPPPNCDASTMDCANQGQAIMAHIIASDLQTLQPWDIRAIQTVYGNGVCSAATNVTINASADTITSGGSSTLTANANGGTAPFNYQWYIGNPPSTSNPTGTNAKTIIVTPASTTTYWVRATATCGATPTDSAPVTITVVTGGGGCTNGGNQLCLAGTRYRVTVVAKDPSGNTGNGTASLQSDVFGYFTLPTLASATDPQIFVKVLGPVGPVPWVFYAGLTNLDYTVTVVDTQTGVLFNTYHVVPPLSDPRNLGANQSVGDYDVNGVSAHDPTQKSIQCAPTNVSSATTSATPGNCPNNSTTLCLLNRFTITLNAKVNNPTGATSVGNTLPGNNQFGFFTTPAIAGATDVQAFVKMLDATSFNGFYWVFLGGLTDFELNFTVTDTQNGRQKIYKKPAGSTCGWNDTAAFSAP